VIEGEKWITTVWMREGVSKADPWTGFDPRGSRMEIVEKEVELPKEDIVVAEVSLSILIFNEIHIH
jgi:hypothetical protein